MQTAWKTAMQPEGFMSVEPLPAPDDLRAFYADRYYQCSASASYQAEYSVAELAYKRLQARVFMQAIGEGVDRRHGVLDVGCGEGFMLAEAARQGWQCVGIDFAAYAIERFHPDLRSHVEIGDAAAIVEQFISAGRRFGSCVLQNVLEHLIDPRQMLSRLKEVLVPGAKVLVTLPNDFSGIQRHVLETGAVEGEYWLTPPQHLHYFNIETGSAFARACAYKVVDVFSDFPIETFLLHPGSNYVRDRSAGPAAHNARMAMSLLCAEKGLDAYLNLCRAYARCGIGRAFTLILTVEEAAR